MKGAKPTRAGATANGRYLLHELSEKVCGQHPSRADKCSLLRPDVSSASPFGSAKKPVKI
jgi:hypothetical protein